MNKILICEESNRPYRIVKPERDFYEKNNIPLPKIHPDLRHQNRLPKDSVNQWYLRNCDKTGEKIISVYDESVNFLYERQI